MNEQVKTVTIFDVFTLGLPRFALATENTLNEGLVCVRALNCHNDKTGQYLCDGCQSDRDKSRMWEGR